VAEHIRQVIDEWQGDLSHNPNAPLSPFAQEKQGHEEN
jgi:hypothetical protein